MQAASGAPLTDSVPRTRSRQPYLLFLVIALVAYALDLGTKTWALNSLRGEPPMEVVGELLRFNLAFNPGAAFSTGTSFTVVLSCIAIAAVFVVLWFARRLNNTLWAVGLGALLGGVLGNLTDRLFRDPGPMRGHVVDFIQLPNWPIFNIADICINIAAGVIILQAFRGISIDGTREKDTKSEPDPESADDGETSGRTDAG